MKMEDAQDLLWKEFNLAEGNPAQGGGILYCMRYSKERLGGHQEQVIKGLRGFNVRITENEENLLNIDIEKTPKDKFERVYRLLEELSVVNEALALNSVGFGNYRNIFELKNGLMTSYLTTLDKDQVSAYDLVDAVIPQVIRDLKISAKQGKKFKAHERRDIQELEEFARRQVQILNSGKYVIFGNS